MIYEMRTYTCFPYKREELVQLMGKLMPAYERNGIRIIGMWTTMIGRAEQFVFLLEYESLGDREKKYAKLGQDLDIQKVMQEKPLLVQFQDNVILQPTVCSPLR